MLQRLFDSISTPAMKVEMSNKELYKNTTNLGGCYVAVKNYYKNLFIYYLEELKLSSCLKSNKNESKPK